MNWQAGETRKGSEKGGPATAMSGNYMKQSVTSDASLKHHMPRILDWQFITFQFIMVDITIDFSTCSQEGIISSLESLLEPPTLKLVVSFSLIIIVTFLIYVCVHIIIYKYNMLSLFFVGGVYMVSRLTTLHWTNKRPYPWDQLISFSQIQAICASFSIS